MKHPSFKGWPLKKIAAWITTNVPGHRATVVPSWTNTDRFTRGGGARCIRWPGKGRAGYLLRVYDCWDKFQSVFAHDSSGTYRTNQDIENWLDNHKED